ncbi:hypothetical protein NG798_14655 [Ancylothrix sp. C2]|uniref:hypothetical protein n=1 Tax=Ancylothrix sp. D3o TaxID=2953691 RepID=UPI0021BB309B|nr:hypothetical protein [Ancylothrix sp. D3o]MCT7951036.1 hypothetical protein [Ancylothrix sp. D3o]
MAEQDMSKCCYRLTLKSNPKAFEAIRAPVSIKQKQTNFLHKPASPNVTDLSKTKNNRPLFRQQTHKTVY